MAFEMSPNIAFHVAGLQEAKSFYINTLGFTLV